MSIFYVVTIGDSPTAVATTLAAAQADAFETETRYTGTERREMRWDEHREGEWRLMSRVRDAATGKGRGRFAWTMCGVREVPGVDA